MADALHSHQSQQDGNEARSGAASVSTSASILSAGELLPAVADETSAMFLQPPTISFTPATPSPPLPTPHEGLDDSVIQGLLSGGVNSLNSPPLGKAALIDPPDPLSLPGVSEGLLKADSGGNAELSDVSESSLDTLSSIVNSTSLSFREISAVAECLQQPGEVPSSSASVTDSQNQQEASSKDVEKSPTVPPTDSLGKEVDGTSEPVRDLMSVNEEVEKALEPSLETIPPKELDASDWKHSFGSGGEGTNCSNGDVQDPKTNDEGHSLLPTEEPAIGTEGLELGAKEPPSPLSEFSAEFAAESQQENCLGSGSSNSEIALPLEMQNSSEDSYSLLNSTITDSSKGALTNPPSECKDVSGTDDVGKSNYLCDGDAANLSSITGNESLLSQIQDSSGRPEAMEVDEENVVQKFDELEKALEVMADMPDSSEVPSSKENSLPDFADLKDGVNKTGGDDGKEVGIVKKVSSLLLNDAEEPLQPVTIGGSLQPLEEVQEASILNDPSFTADLSLIESSADEADSIGGLVINSVIGAADGVADFPPDDEMETERQLMDISSSAPRVNHGVCEVDASEDIEPSAKRRKLENGEKEDDVLVDARSVTFKVLPVKNGHGLWDSIKLKEILLSKGTLHLRIHASSNDLETFEPEKCEIEVDFTCIMVSALEEECDSALGNSTQDPEVFDPLAIGATIGAVESNSPPHYPRPFGAQTRGRSTALQPAMPRPPYRQLQSPPHAYNKNEVLGLAQGIEFEETPGTTEWSGKEYYAGLLLPRKALPLSHHYHPAFPAQLLPARGRKRGRPPLSGRRGFSPAGGSPRSSPSKAKSQGKNLPDPIKFRPPTPPQHLLISSLLKLNKSPTGNNKKSKGTGDERKSRDGPDDDEEIVTMSQPHYTNNEDSNDTDTSVKRFLFKLACEFCNTVFRKRASLNAHIKHTHRREQKCPICNASVKVKSKYGMRFHILRAHRDQPNFHCAKCGETFRLKHHLMNHVRMKHEYSDSEVEEEAGDVKERKRKDCEQKEREMEKETREAIEAEERKVRENIEKERLERLREMGIVENGEREGKDAGGAEARAVKGVDESAAQTSVGKSAKCSESVTSNKIIPNVSNSQEKVKSEETQLKSVVGSVVANDRNRNVKPVSRGKVMNVRPPDKLSVPKSKDEGKRPAARRMTRSCSKTEAESDNETNASGSDNADDDSSDSSSGEEEEEEEVVVSEKSGRNCDICGKEFSHVFKLKHHLKSEHSITAKPKRAAKEGKSRIDADEEEVSAAAADEEEDFEEEEEEEEDSSEANEDEDDDLEARKVRKERERKEKEISLTCSTCNKVCRSEYQLKLHLPIHTVVRKKKLGRKSLVGRKSSSSKSRRDEDAEEDSPEKPSKDGESPRVLRSTPSGHANRTGKPVGRPKLLDQRRESNPRGRPSLSKLESASGSPKDKPEAVQKKGSGEGSGGRHDRGERPSFILKVGHLFRCTKCNVTFNREKSMTYHLKKIHETLYPFKACEHCGRVFRSCGPYNRHLLQHKVYYCPEGNCKAKFRKMLRLKQHQKNAHPTKKHRCPKCVLLFSKRTDLDRHYDSEHPKQQSDEEEEEDEDESCSEGEEEEIIKKDVKENPDDRKKDVAITRKKERADERETSERKKRGYPLREQKKEKAVDSKADEAATTTLPQKRKARCIPISYKEPEDEEDLGSICKAAMVVPVSASRDTRNSRERCSITSDVKSIFEKKVPEIKTEKTDVKAEVKSHSVTEAPRRTRLKEVEEKKSVGDGNMILQDKVLKKKKSAISLRSGDTTSVKGKLSKMLSARKNDKASKFRISPRVKVSHSKHKLKKTKVTLSWTAALKAQIRAAESDPKNAVVKKKKKPPKEKPAGTKPATKTSAKGSAKSNPKTSTSKSKARSSSVGSGVGSLNATHDFMHHSDSLSYPGGYLVGDDSMFSLDDSSQMDLIGDYYGSQYPPSEEISDFVPDDDESGPAKIIGFDSF